MYTTGSYSLMHEQALPITTVMFFRFSDWRHKYWAFTQMRLAIAHLMKVRGAEFAKFMDAGSGGGFSWWPDFSVYALFVCWKNADSFQQFTQQDSFYRELISRSTESFSLELEAYQFHGEWEGKNLFQNHRGTANPEGYVAVLTRASVKPRKLLPFWRLVPRISNTLEQQPELVFSKGVGEWPLVELTTLSVWKSEEAVQSFAYATPSHLKAIKQTRERGLFSEELFARFKVLEMNGRWNNQEMCYSQDSSQASGRAV